MQFGPNDQANIRAKFADASSEDMLVCFAVNGENMDFRVVKAPTPEAIAHSGDNRGGHRVRGRTQGQRDGRRQVTIALTPIVPFVDGQNKIMAASLNTWRTGLPQCLDGAGGSGGTPQHAADADHHRRGRSQADRQYRARARRDQHDDGRRWVDSKPRRHHERAQRRELPGRRHATCR